MRSPVLHVAYKFQVIWSGRFWDTMKEGWKKTVMRKTLNFHLAKIFETTPNFLIIKILDILSKQFMKKKSLDSSYRKIPSKSFED